MSTPRCRKRGICNTCCAISSCREGARRDGGSYGRGLATCRTGHGWSAPMFVAIDGGTVGYQIGGSSTDIVMLFMNDHSLHSLLSDKFKLGAPGP